MLVFLSPMFGEYGKLMTKGGGVEKSERFRGPGIGKARWGAELWS